MFFSFVLLTDLKSHRRKQYLYDGTVGLEHIKMYDTWQQGQKGAFVGMMPHWKQQQTKSHTHREKWRDFTIMHWWSKQNSVNIHLLPTLPSEAHVPTSLPPSAPQTLITLLFTLHFTHPYRLCCAGCAVELCVFCKSQWVGSPWLHILYGQHFLRDFVCGCWHCSPHIFTAKQHSGPTCLFRGRWHPGCFQGAFSAVKIADTNILLGPPHTECVFHRKH